MRHTELFETLIDTLKTTVATLRTADIPFMVGGSLAAWARGGPEPQNDLDLMLRPEHADRALEALTRAGMRPERPPEEWLLKAWNGRVLVDLIFHPAGLEITDDVFERADVIAVMSVATPVMGLDDALITMLYAMDEHSLDYGALVAIARSLREQIDWAALRARASGSPYAKAFFTLVEELGIAPSQPRAAASPGGRVRVLPTAGQRGTSA